MMLLVLLNMVLELRIAVVAAVVVSVVVALTMVSEAALVSVAMSTAVYSPENGRPSSSWDHVYRS